MSKGLSKRYYGLHCCFAIVESRPKSVRRVFISRKVQTLCKPLIEWCEKKKVTFKLTDDAELTRVAATEHHEGVVLEADSLRQPSLTELVKDFKQRKDALVVFLDGVENPHNLGAAMRTCAFFGVDAMVVSAREMTELSPASCRVAEGGAEDLPVALVSTNADVIGSFKGAGFSTLATTPHGGESLFSVKWPKKSLVVFGAEGPGLSADALRMADQKVCIPRHKGARIESLNVASAVAVCIAVAKGGGKK